MRTRLSMRAWGGVWAGGAFAAALGAAAIWAGSQMAWQAHLSRAAQAGAGLYAALEYGAAPPSGLYLVALAPEAAAQADAGAFAALKGAPHPTLVTHIPVRTPTGIGEISTTGLSLAVLSGELQYPIARLEVSGQSSAQDQLGAVARLLASYCADPMVLARADTGAWFRIEGEAIWGCAAAPADRRLWAVALALAALALIFVSIGDTSQRFRRFANELRDRHRHGGPEHYATQGPAELDDMAHAINTYLERERALLEKRAMVLSGVSHDLGTPATRLRLRAALIEDASLRDQFAGDIDRMAEMIESVLTYTRSEMNVEAPRQLSLSALVEALVADYQDAGQPVEFDPDAAPPETGASTVFTSWQARVTMPEKRRILMSARPLALQRAITNLIDNALKYGRRAHVRLEANSEMASILVEDEGGRGRADEMAALLAPFRRGDGTEAIKGYGLGLTIVSTIAEQHGGSLSFESSDHGLRARLDLPRA